MTKIKNSKQVAFDLICDLDIAICNLIFICNLVLVICYFRFIRVGIFQPVVITGGGRLLTHTTKGGFNHGC